MRRSLSLLPFAAAALLLGASVAGAGDAAPPPVPDDEVRATLGWFGGLGLAPSTDRPFVRYTFGGWSGYAGAEVATTRVGFLLHEDATSFRVVTPRLDDLALTRTPKGTPAHEAVGFAPADLLAFAREVLAPDPSRESEWDESDECCFDERVGLLVLARACDAKGDHALAARLVSKAADRREEDSTPPLRDFLEDLVAAGLHVQTTLDLADVHVPRTEILAKWRRAVALLPARSDTKQPISGATSREMLVTMERMVEEDAAHRPPVGWPDVAPAVAAREWVFRLRDQHGVQTSHPGSCNVFSNETDDTTTPAHALDRLGYDAVPALLDALGDRRPIRSLGYVGHGYGFRSLSVDDAVRQILEAIAGRSFDEEPANGKPKRTYAESARAWWDEIQRRGPQQVLVEGASRGDRDSVGQAWLLVERFPALALDAIAAGVRRTGNDGWWVREQLVRIAGRLSDDAATAFLLDELKTGATTSALAAAEALTARGRPDGLDAMIEVARTAKSSYEVDHAIAFIICSGEPRAIDALRTTMDRRTADDRIGVMRSVSDGSRGKPKPQDAWREAAEQLLIERLLDRETVRARTLTWDSTQFIDPRVCDVAALALCELRGKPDAFPLRGSTRRRDRACVDLVNSWRAARDLPPLPVPAQPSLPVVDGELVARALDDVFAAADPAHRDASLTRLRELGLGALPAVRAATARPADEATLAALRALARELASFVRCADFAPSIPPVEPPDEAERDLAALRGRQFRSADLVATIVVLLRTLPDTAEGIELTAERSEDGTGFAISVKYLPFDGKAPFGPDVGWRSWRNLVCAGKPLDYGGADCARIDLLEVQRWSDFAKQVDAVLSADPLDPIEMHVDVRRGD